LCSSAIDNNESNLTIRDISELDPQELRFVSPGFRPLSRCFLAAIPQVNPQIFRAFSASFAHGLVRVFLRSVSAAISQELANSAAKKNGEKKANGARLRKKQFAVRSSQFAAGFPPRPRKSL